MYKEYIRHSDNTHLCVLFIHGILSGPFHFSKFYDHFDEDVAVYGMLLDGHGGTVRDFARASMKKWKNQVSDTVKELLEKYEKIVIVGHSMGSFFAVEEAIKYREKIQSVCLLQPALCIGVKPWAVKYSLMVLFDVKDEKNVTLKEYSESHSIQLTKRLWQYIGWLPRFFELAGESKRIRKRIEELKTPCVVFLSQKDELVSVRSKKYVPVNDNIKLHMLPQSSHFIYDKNDERLILENILNLIK